MHYENGPFTAPEQVAALNAVAYLDHLKKRGPLATA